MNRLKLISLRNVNSIRSLVSCVENDSLYQSNLIYNKLFKSPLLKQNLYQLRSISSSSHLSGRDVKDMYIFNDNDDISEDLSSTSIAGNVFRESRIDLEYDELAREKQTIRSEEFHTEKEGDFSKYPISEASKKNLRKNDIQYLFPVQTSTFLDIYDGKDIIVQARTGTGKTLSYAIPIMEKMLLKSKNDHGRIPRTIVLVPTRELAAQVTGVFNMLNKDLKVVPFYGGIGYGEQSAAIQNGLDVVVGTPGRILDFVQQGMLDFSALEHVVLDEVDRMLDMGFAPQVDDIIKSAYVTGAKKPQTCLWSATVPSWVKQTARKYMSENTRYVDLVGTDKVKTSTTVRHVSLPCGFHERCGLISDLLKVHSGEHGRAMVFCQTKREADEIAVNPIISVETHVLHGDIPQAKREMVLKGFRDGRYKCLVTTDVAARGLDIPEVDLIIQCSPPQDMDSYVHRSGRTGRAGKPGLSICLYQPNEKSNLREVEKYAGISFKVSAPPSPDEIIAASADDVLKSLTDINPDILQQFTNIAVKAGETLGYERALSAAFAVISGTTKLHSRSLLTSAKGFKTYMFATKNVINYPSYVWKNLNHKLPTEIMDHVKFIRVSLDKTSAVFDIPEHMATELENQWMDSRFDTLSEATFIPELQDQPTTRKDNFSDNKGPRRTTGMNYSNGYNNYKKKDGYNDFKQRDSYSNNNQRNNFRSNNNRNLRSSDEDSVW